MVPPPRRVGKLRRVCRLAPPIDVEDAVDRGLRAVCAGGGAIDFVQEGSEGAVVSCRWDSACGIGKSLVMGV